MDTFIWYKNCQKWSDDIFPRWLPHGHWKTPVPRLSRSLSPWEVIFFLLFFNLVRCIFVFNPNERHFYENVSKCVFLKKWKKDMIYKTTWQCKHLKGQLDPPVREVTFFNQKRPVGSLCWLVWRREAKRWEHPKTAFLPDDPFWLWPSF